MIALHGVRMKSSVDVISKRLLMGLTNCFSRHHIRCWLAAFPPHRQSVFQSICAYVKVHCSSHIVWHLVESRTAKFYINFIIASRRNEKWKYEKSFLPALAGGAAETRPELMCDGKHAQIVSKYNEKAKYAKLVIIMLRAAKHFTCVYTIRSMNGWKMFSASSWALESGKRERMKRDEWLMCC